jgi:succinate-semialdehyde dehydrogenase/glutarate-semialdehyde dehydrogenase
MLGRNFIAGEWREPAAGDTVAVRDAASGELLSWIPAGAEADVDAAVQAAMAAAPGWASTAPADRGAALGAGARALRERIDAVTELQSREGGVPREDSRAGVEAGIRAIEQAGEDPVGEPRGVVALLTSSSDPVATACSQIAAALGSGDAVVFKPSERTPLSAVLCVEAIAVELPAGVLNLLLGDGGAGAMLAAHQGIDLLLDAPG